MQDRDSRAKLIHRYLDDALGAQDLELAAQGRDVQLRTARRIRRKTETEVEDFHRATESADGFAAPIDILSDS